jgi:phosphoribosylamine-glycine ligase
MTATEIATETEKIRAGIDKLTEAVRASGLTEGASVTIAALRKSCADAHARMLADQEACIALLDTILCQEVAA